MEVNGRLKLTEAVTLPWAAGILGTRLAQWLTCGQFRVSIWHNLHVFGLWGKFFSLKVWGGGGGGRLVSEFNNQIPEV